MSKSSRFGCLGLVLITPPLLLLVIHLVTVRLPPYVRHPLTVHFLVIDQLGRPVPKASMITHESGWRYYLPIPFSPQWHVHFKQHTTNATESGEIVISYRQDYLRVDSLLIDGVAVTDYQSTFHRFDGTDFPLVPIGSQITEQYGIYPKAPDPYRRNYTIKIVR